VNERNLYTACKWSHVKLIKYDSLSLTYNLDNNELGDTNDDSNNEIGLDQVW